MCKIEKLLEKLNETQLANWEKMNYTSPEILNEIYDKVRNLILDLGKFSRFFDYAEQTSEWKDNRGMYETRVREKLFAAGGYVSDFVISEIHSTPFVPKDIDFFFPGNLLQEILNPYIYSEDVEITKEEKEEREKNNLDFYQMDGLFYKTPERKNEWDFFGNKLKEIFPNVRWNNDSKFGYEFAEINVVYYIDYKGFSIELVIGEDERILNFDVSFRCAYFNEGNIYMNSFGLNDIKEKKLRILHSETPISTCLRMMDFQERYGFEIDSLSLMMLFNAINNKQISYDHFLETMRRHKKYSSHLEDLFLSFPHKKESVLVHFTYDTNDNVDVIQFELSYFKEYDKELDEIYKQCNELLKNKGSIVYPKLETFLRNYKNTVFTYKRPENWYSSGIFSKSIYFGKDFINWYNEKSLQVTFSGDKEGELKSEEINLLYDIIALGLDKLNEIDFKHSISSTVREKQSLSATFLMYVPLIAYNEELHFKLNSYRMKELIFDGIINPIVCNEKIEGLILSQSFLIDKENKKIIFFRFPSDTYFGLVGDLYEDYTNQWKKSLGLEGYNVEISKMNRNEFANLKDFYDINEASLMEAAEEKAKKDTAAVV